MVHPAVKLPQLYVDTKNFRGFPDLSETPPNFIRTKWGLTPHFMIFLACVQPNYNWLVVLTILKTLVSWDYYSRYMENTPNVPNHPPDIDLDISIVE